MENLGKTEYNALDLEESIPLEGNQLLISLLLIIVKASLKNDLAILLDLYTIMGVQHVVLKISDLL